MARGQKALPGATRTAPNGYHYTKDEEGRWRLTHHIVLEKELGRRIKAHERIVFVDGDRSNRNPSNLAIKEISAGKDKKIEEIRTKIAVLERQLSDLLEEE